MDNVLIPGKVHVLLCLELGVTEKLWDYKNHQDLSSVENERAVKILWEHALQI